MAQLGVSAAELDGPPELRVQASVTEPVYPPLPVTVTVDMGLPPGETVPGAVAAMVKVGVAAALTVTLTVVACVAGPVPVTVMT